MITIESRKTYKSLDGKSYFTKKAAIKRSVIEKLKIKHGTDGCIDSLIGLIKKLLNPLYKQSKHRKAYQQSSYS